MKTAYYTSTTIDQQARDFLKQLQYLRVQHQNQCLLPAKTALLVIDMQNFFNDSTSHAFIPSMSAIVPKLKKLQECFLQQTLMVIQTQHGNTLSNCGAMERWWRQPLLDLTDPLMAIIPELETSKIPVIAKTQYDAFWQTDLEQRLHERGITQIIVTGVMAHLCCETTARVAFVKGFEVFFAVDGTATYDAEFHFATLRNLAHGFAVPLLVDEIIEVLG